MVSGRLKYEPTKDTYQKLFSKNPTRVIGQRKIEYQLDREQYEDFSDSARLTLGDLIIKYRDEITPNKKGEREEAYKLNLLLRHKIAKCRLLDLKAKNIFDFKSDIRINRKPATVNKYIHYIHTIWETAKVQWDIALPSRNPSSLVGKEKNQN